MSQGLRLTIRYILLIFVSLAIPCGCYTVKKLEPSSTSKYEGFIHDGKTTKQEIIGRFGLASSLYENERILIYHVYLKEDGQITIKGVGTCHALVVVFNENNVLEKHSFVKDGCQ